jgi:ribulose-bisphosphate carboxylase small chain
MRVTQGTFSYLPDLTDAQIRRQLEYALEQGWALSVERTEDPHPRNVYWELWGMPQFDLRDADAIVREIRACREAHPASYVKVNAFDSTRGWETVRLSFLVQRPPHEPGFELERAEGPGRTVRYAIRRRAAGAPARREG